MLGFAAVSLALGIGVAIPFLILLPLFIVIAWLTYKLTIEVDETYLRWWFGPGMFHKRVALSDIRELKRVRTNFLEGWGIHISRYGWLYNVSGFDALAITLANGKRFALGTDEPEALAKAIAAAAPAVRGVDPG